MERIIVEQLRDRLYYATDTIVTYIDSRVLICNSNEFPQSLEDKAEFITTSKYYILESGDLCPCNDLYYKEDIRLFISIGWQLHFFLFGQPLLKFILILGYIHSCPFM